MRFYHLTGPGPIAQPLRLATATCPSPESLERDQVLIEVVVAGINPADYKIPELGYVAKAIMPFPKAPGMDFGGRVVAMGPDILHIKTGDRVIGSHEPLELRWVIVRAGVAATAALTAYQSIVPFVKKGDKVFLNGGSGGTGTFGIQIAKALGCHVTVSCSTAKVSLCRDLGADEIIDYKTTDVTVALCGKGKVFTLAVDSVGNSPANLFPSAKNFLVSEGKFKFIGGAVSFAVVKNILPSILLPSLLGGSDHKFEVFATKNSHEDMAQISTWMGEGKLKTVIDSTFAFEDVLKAYQKLKQGSARGKILVRVREGKRVIETVRDELN